MENGIPSAVDSKIAKDDSPTDVSTSKTSNINGITEVHIDETEGNSKRKWHSIKELPRPTNGELVKKEKKRKSFAQPTIELLEATKVKFTSLRDLALYVLQVSNDCPGFIKITNRHAIRKVVVLVVPGIGLEKDFPEDSKSEIDVNTKLPDGLLFVKTHFKQSITTIAPGDKDSIYPLMKAFSTRPFTKKEKTRIRNELSKKKVYIPDISMTYDQLVSNDYPIHPKSGDTSALLEGWVDTKPFEHGGSHTFALDCEMCQTAKGKVLTKISLIDFEENVIIDEFVKPDEEITDYLTAYSGITAELLKNVTTTLSDIQQKIIGIVSSNDYLIGHSLENDLKVLKIRHPNIVDTAIVFEHTRGPPFKSSLKYLSKTHLQSTIQEGSHDPLEDAKACLSLVKLKLLEGGLLGKVIDGRSIFQDMEAKGKRAIVLDYSPIQSYQNKLSSCHNDADITRTLIEKLDENDLIVGNLKELDYSSSAQYTDLNAKDHQDLDVILERLNARITNIYENLPSNTFVIFTTGTGNQSSIRALLHRKRVFAREFADSTDNKVPASTWTNEDEISLKEELKIARCGVTFFDIKV